MTITITESQVERALERGGRFLKTVARNPVVRGALFARGLTDEELQRGWGMYAALHGFPTSMQARATTSQTAAAEAINRIDGWDAPTFAATRAVLAARFPQVRDFLFDNLEASEGVQAGWVPSVFWIASQRCAKARRRGSLRNWGNKRSRCSKRGS